MSGCVYHNLKRESYIFHKVGNRYMGRGDKMQGADVNPLSIGYKIQQEEGKMRLQRDQGKFIFYGYNISRAVDYALTYALEMNPKFGNYEKWGGDCTNYVSQCLYAGGIPFDEEGMDVRYKWYWYSEAMRAPSWTAADSLRFYMENNNNQNQPSFGLRAEPTTIYNLLRGDVIQFVESDNQAYHSIICTGYIVRNGQVVDYLISQHSGYREDNSVRLKNYPLSRKKGNKIFWSIEGYNKRNI